MNVVVLGAGSVGMTLGAVLTGQGHNVHLVARERHVAQIRKDGIRVSGCLGDLQARPASANVVAKDLPAEDYDLILVTVKSFDTLGAIAACTPFLKPTTAVVSVQNGLGNLETLESFLGPEHPIFGSVSLFGCETTGPATVRITSHKCEAKIGVFNEAARKFLVVAETLAESLTRGGMRTTISRDCRTDLWSKFLMNAMTNALSAIEDKTLAELFESTRVRLTMDELLDEMFPLARQAGVALPWAGPAQFLEFYKQNILPQFASHRPSMAQDLSQGRRTEIASLNGHMVQLANRFGLPAPVNGYVSAVVGRMERLAMAASKAARDREAQYA